MSKWRRAVPWWLRIGAKIVLARVPVPYGFWKRLGLFELGDMNEPRRALDTVLMHATTAQVLDDSRPPRFRRQSADFAVLELGPGDSLFTGVIAKALGASRSWLVDVGAFATMEPWAYDALLKVLAAEGYDPFPEVSDVERLKDECGIVYLTRGLDSLREMPDACVDFCFSNAVLAQVRREEFEALLGETRRVLKPNGVCVHRVDLRDHLGGALNNLRFDKATWEGRLFRESGFYTNRIRFAEMLDIFERAGFTCHTPRVARWDRLPTPRAKLAEPFRQMPEDSLLVSGFDAVLRARL